MEAVTAVGLTLNIVRLAELAAQTGHYINATRNASKSRARLAREATSLLLLLTDLRHRLEDVDTSSDPWFRGIRSLVVQHGVLDLFKTDLQALGEKLDPQAGWKKAGSLMLWPLKEKDIERLLSQIERLKSLVTVALQQDGFSLMLAMRTQNTELANSITRMTKDLGELQHDSIEYALALERRKVIAWLSPLNFTSQQDDTISKRQAHTGRWFFKTQQFQSWMHGEEAVLWCTGIPGSGKTVLTSVVVAYLQHLFASQLGARIGYLYLNHQQHSNHTPTTLIGSLLQQLVRSEGHVVSNELIEYYESHSDVGRRPRLSEIFQILQAEVRRLDVYFVVLDALDEGAETTRSILLAHLVRLRPKIRLMVTSRQKPIPIYDLQSVLILEIRARNTDLRLYLRDRLKELPMARHIEGDRMLEAHIVETIVNKAKGM
ncbi:hypothetical protein MMC17_003190 [Xylographa soralifera]|nr:hypothetical protein [Xylographa soralifera]